MPPIDTRPGRIALRLIGILAVLGVAATAAGFLVYTNTQKPTDPIAKVPEGSKPEPKVDGAPLFAGWPKEKPDLVIVVSGQMYGYLSPCGCSRPQTGGLERRYNLIQQLKSKGWEVIGVDVGEVASHVEKGTLRQQNLLKYGTAMKTLKEMGYIAVGVGVSEFQNDLMKLLGQYTVGHPNERPVVLGANLVGGVTRNDKREPKEGTGKARADFFKGPPGERPLVEDVEVYQGKSVSVGVIGTVAPSIARQIVDADGSYDFSPNGDVLTAALAKADKDPAKPELKVLLFQGGDIEARKVAADFPQFNLIVRTSDDTEGMGAGLPITPDKAPNTRIVHVGHKGQNVAVVGVFKTPKGFDLQYQLVPLGEEFLTAEGAEAEQANKALALLEKYTAEVKKADLLGASVKARGSHPYTAIDEKMKFAGVDACKTCHAAEVKKWGETKHSHAYDALEKLAKRPGNRQTDPDCLSCHTTGFAYKTGFESVKATPHLLHNQCENCHGPASEHAAFPKDAKLIAKLSPWKVDDGKGKMVALPDEAFIKKMAELKESERGQVKMDARQQLVKNNVQTMCMRCHDLDNDPKFDLWTYLPKIDHRGLKQKESGLPEGVGK